MSIRTITAFKGIAPSYIRNAKFTYSVLSDFASRMVASACPKVKPSFVDQRVASKESRAHLTARCPRSLTKSMSPVTVEEQRPLPEHEPNPFALMTPLKAVKPLTLLAQQGILNRRTAKDWKSEDQTIGAVAQPSITQRLMELLKKDSLEDSEDDQMYSSSTNSIYRRNLRLEEEDRNERRRPAKSQGPPETPKPKYDMIQEESQTRLHPKPSAVYEVRNWLFNKAPMQAAPRRPACVSITNPSFLNKKEQSIINTVRPIYQFKPENPHPHPHQHPVNVVRPDIPPLSTTPRLSEIMLQLQRARNIQVRRSMDQHASRTSNCVAWFRRKFV